MTVKAAAAMLNSNKTLKLGWIIHGSPSTFQFIKYINSKHTGTCHASQGLLSVPRTSIALGEYVLYFYACVKVTWKGFVIFFLQIQSSHLLQIM